MADLLKAEIETMKAFGIESVALAGLPDSHLSQCFKGEISIGSMDFSGSGNRW